MRGQHLETQKLECDQFGNMRPTSFSEWSRNFGICIGFYPFRWGVDYYDLGADIVFVQIGPFAISLYGWGGWGIGA